VKKANESPQSNGTAPRHDAHYQGKPAKNEKGDPLVVAPGYRFPESDRYRYFDISTRNAVLQTYGLAVCKTDASGSERVFAGVRKSGQIGIYPPRSGNIGEQNSFPSPEPSAFFPL
jgi:hypothetical protein